MNKKYFKKGLFIFWIVIIIFVLYKLFSLGIPLSDYPDFIAEKVSALGIWAPIIYILLFAIRPLVFFPASLLSLSSGVIFGPYKAILILIVAENISSVVSCSTGRYFGKSIIDELDKSNKIVDKFTDYIHDNEFVSILTLRLIFVPFDLLGYFSGMTGIKFKSYMSASIIGIFPGLFTSAFLGGAIHNPINVLISGGFIIFGLVVSKIIKSKHKKQN